MGVEFAPGASGAPACRWKPYTTYKDSGAEWLGEMPEHWDVKKLKFLVSSDTNSFVDGPFGSDLKNEEYKDDGVPLIQLNNIFPGKHVLKNTKYISEEKAHDLSRHVILPGQIVIAKMAEPVARASCVSSVYSKYVIVADCVKFNPNDELTHIPFLVYSINSSHVRYKAELLSTGTTRLRINLGSIKNLSLLFPPILEQRAIASFLDRKTAHIDILISKKERLITLLQEKRAALISHTVTKGLDPDVPMKDSGVEWLGEIPAHWVNIRLKMLVNLINQKAGNENIKYIGLENIESLTGNIIETDVTPEGIANLFSSNDVLFGKLRPYLSKVLIPDFEGCCTSELLVLRPKKITRHFLFFYFLSDQFIEIVNSSTYGAKMPRANWDFIGNMVISCPPAIEQRNITSFLDCGIEKIDALISKIHKAIEKLQEYRTALISAAVTGKIDVRNENRN